MSLLRNRTSGLTVALDVGSQSIKGLVFSVKDGFVADAHKRIGADIPPGSAAGRIAGELHSALAGVIKEFGRIPSQVIAGFGASLAEYHLERWSMETDHGKTHITQKDLSGWYARLLEQNTKKDRAMIATAAGVEIDGYAVSREALAPDLKHALENPGGTGRGVVFRTVIARLPSEIGAELDEMKRMLGGVPIEFVPLAAVYQEALVHCLRVRDALLIDVGSTVTMIVMIKDSLLAGTASFPFGTLHLLKEQPAALMPMWARSLATALDSLYVFGPLAGDTYLCGGGAYVPEVRTYLEHGEWLKNFSYAQIPRVTVLEGKTLLDGETLKGLLRGPDDAGLAAVAWYGMHREAIV